jgi:cyclophilin family peptidyl-prolyl cis-trans isomerase
MKRNLIAVLFAFVMMAACAQPKENMSNTTTQTPSEGDVVCLHTNMGDIRILLYSDTPLHHDNFLKLAREGFYDGLLFHRVIKDFMIQGGDPDSKTAAPEAQLGGGDVGYQINAEILYPRHFHKYGAVAAARTSDEVNPERKSSGCQFYIVTGKKYNEATLHAYMQRVTDSEKQAYFNRLVRENADTISVLRKNRDEAGLESLRQELIKKTNENVVPVQPTAEMVEAYATIGGTPHLDNSYTVFGEVLEGMDVVEKIQNVAVSKSDRPLEDVKILTVTIEN